MFPMNARLSGKRIFALAALTLLSMARIDSSLACISTPTPTPTPVVADSPRSEMADGWSRPLAPSGLVVERGAADPATQAQLRWTDRSERETGYRVERSYDSGVTWDALPALAAGTSSTLDTGLSSGVLVNYRVRAVIGNAVESLSAAAGAYQTAPATPVVSIAGGGGTMAELHWTAVAGATSYDIYMLDENGNWVLVAQGVTGLSWVDRTSALGRAGGYRVVARLPGGAVSAASSTVSAPQGFFKLQNDQGNNVCMITEAGRLIHAGSVYEIKTQTAVNALAAVNGVKLWRLDDANSQTLAAVILQAGESACKAGDLWLKGLLYVDDSSHQPSSSDPYTWWPPNDQNTAIASLDASGNLKVRAYDGWGPCNLTATAQANKQILLEWDDFTSRTIPSDFKVERSLSAAFTSPVNIANPQITVQGTRFSCTDADARLQDGTQYYYRVSRVLRGRAWYSNVADTWTHPPAPRFRMIAPSGNHSILMTWDKVTSAGVTGYRLWRATSEAQLFGDLAALPSVMLTSSTAYNDNGQLLGPLTGSTAYWYLLKSINPGGDSDTGDTTSTATLQDPKLIVRASMAGTTPPTAVSASITVQITHSNKSVEKLTGTTTFNHPLQAGDVVVLGDLTMPPLAERIIQGWKVNGTLNSTKSFATFTVKELRDYEVEAVYAGLGMYYVSPAFEDGAVSPLMEYNGAIKPARLQAMFNKPPTGLGLRVYGSIAGGLGTVSGAAATGGDVFGLSNSPSIDFWPDLHNRPEQHYRAGETISATLTTETQASGQRLYRPTVWRFTTRTGDAKQPTSYSLAQAFALGADAHSSATCLAAVNPYSTTTLQTAVGVYRGQNRIEFHDLASSACLSRTFDDLLGDSSTSPTLDFTTAIAAADLNPLDPNSSAVDLVVANYGGPSYVYLSGQGDLHSFHFLNRYEFADKENAQAVAVGDLNGDGFQDVVLGNRAQFGSVYFNNGHGELTREGGFGSGRANVTAVAIADMNLDGALDIVVGCSGSGFNRIYLNDGAGHFSDDRSTTRSIPFGSENPMTTALAVINTRDLRDNAWPDIVVGNHGPKSKVYLNKSGETLQFEEVGLLDANGLETNWPTRAVAAADFNADGFIDVALGNDEGSPNLVYLNEGKSNPQSQDHQNRVFRLRGQLGASGTETFETRGLAAADYDGDGDLDLAVLQQGAPGQLFLRGESADPIQDSPFRIPGGDINLCYAYDWAVALPISISNLLHSQPLLEPADAYFTDPGNTLIKLAQDDTPAVATDGKGHWVMAWSSDNALNYTSSPFFTKNPQVKNFNLGNDLDIVVSRFWDRRGTVENHFDPEHQDPWRTLEMDQDTLWTPPVPLDEESESTDARPLNFNAPYNQQDYRPSIATDRHGNWAIAWVAYDAVPLKAGDISTPGTTYHYNPRVMMSISNSDATTWTRPFLVRDLKLDVNPRTSAFEFSEWVRANCRLTPKISCDGTSPTSHWMITYPAAAKNTVYASQQNGHHRSYDTDIYVSLTSTTLSGGQFVWPSNYQQLTERKVNSNSITFALSDSNRYDHAPDSTGDDLYADYPDGTVIDDPYDGTDACRLDNETDGCHLGGNADCESTANDGIQYSGLGGGNSLDTATDGHGNWVAVWTSNVTRLRNGKGQWEELRDLRLSKGSGSETDILFAFSSDNGRTWSAPYYLNSSAVCDNADPGAKDLNPSIATDGTRWMVFWQTHSRYNTGTNYSKVAGAATLDPANGIGEMGDIACAATTTKDLLALRSGQFWSQQPWSTATIFNSDAVDNFEDGQPCVSASASGDWLLVWRKQQQDTSYLTHYAVSRDGGVTWESTDKSTLFSSTIPPQTTQRHYAMAADTTGNFILGWAAHSPYHPPYIVPTTSDEDIITLRTAGLLTGDHKPVAIQPRPVPTPTPPPVVVPPSTDPTGMPPARVTNLAGLPEGLSDCAPRYVCPATPAEPMAGSEKDTLDLGSAMIFHMPLLDADASVKRVRDIRQVDLSFKAGRDTPATPAQYRVFVFKGGCYGADEWANPSAWEEVVAPTGTGMTWGGMAERSLALTGNFERYLSPAPAEVNPLRFGPLGQTSDVSRVLTTGTLTWAVYSLPANSGTPGKLHFDAARAVVWPAVRPTERPLFTDDLKLTCSLNLWARVEAGQLAQSTAAPCGTRGDVRLILEANADGSLTGRLRWSLSLQDAGKGMQVRLRGYAGRNQNPSPITDRLELKTLCTLTSDGVALAQGDWNFANDSAVFGGSGRAASLKEFVSMLLAEQVYIELTGPAGGAGFVRGQVEPDRDDDGLTDYEEDKNHNGQVDPGETNPYDRDSDDDGLLDGEEVRAIGLLAYTKKTDPWSLDKEGADPFKVDTDGDGLSDALEAGMTTATLDSRKATRTKAFSWNWGSDDTTKGSESHDILATTPTLAGGIHKLSGLHLIDADPATVTHPQKPDTDKDGFWDGPDIWADAKAAGLVLRAGEDKNGNGRIDWEGNDGEAETEDDESDPNNGVSKPGEKNSILSIDADNDGLNDVLEDQYGCDSQDSDTDDDGVKDGDEVFIYNTLPHDPDSDHDGLPDGFELGLTYAASGAVNNEYNRDWSAHIDRQRTYLVRLAADGPLLSQRTFLPSPDVAYRSDPKCFDSNLNRMSDAEEYYTNPEADMMRGLVRRFDQYVDEEVDFRRIDPIPIDEGDVPVNGDYKIFLNKVYDDEGEPHWEALLPICLGNAATQPIELTTTPATPVFRNTDGIFVSSLNVTQEMTESYKDRFKIARILLRCPEPLPDTLIVNVKRSDGDIQHYSVGLNRYYVESELPPSESQILQASGGYEE